MARSWKRWSCQLGLIACLGAGATVVEASIEGLWFRSSVLAQVTPDGTLNTTVNAAGNNFTITNGTARGDNLFHSFGQFSIPTGGAATFNLLNTPNITTIFSRVTGGSASNIDGLIRTLNSNNSVSLFLMNPSGIIFGPNARLNIGGAFVGTTANSIKFADGTEFSAQSPPSTPLLTISTPIGLQFGQTPEEIRSGLRIGSGINSRYADFALVGGDVTLDDSILIAPGRRVELMGVDENGTVGLRLNGDRLSLSLAAGTPRRDITFNGSFADAAASTGGGEVVVTGRNIVLEAGSGILTGILPGSDNSVTNQASDITIDAAATLQLTQGSIITNQVDPNAIGQGGNISITASDVRGLDNSGIFAVTAATGTGNAGNVRVTANTITLDGAGSGIFSAVRSRGIGSGGNVTVETGSLRATNGAGVSASTSGTGDAGDVRVTANTITLDGTTPNGRFASGIASAVGSTGIGSGGNVTVETGSLRATNGAGVSAATFGIGDAGNVRVTANTVDLSGSLDGQRASGIGSQVGDTGWGSGGNVTVETGSLRATNGAGVSAATFGIGDAGNVRVTANTITLDGTTPNGQIESGIDSGVGSTGIGSGGDVTVETGSLSATNGAIVSASTFGTGNAGNVRITANTITLDGTTPDGQFVSGIDSDVGSTGIGSGGDVTVETGSLRATNGAGVSASTSGTGDAGDVRVTANTIDLNGTTPNGQFISGIFSAVDSIGIGSGGDVTVETGSLRATNGAGVSASTSGTGDAGDVRVTANTIDLNGTTPNGRFASAIGSQVGRTGWGSGGNVTVETGSLSVTNGATVSSSALGNGSAGNLDITARTLRLDRGQIIALAFSGDGANINLTIGDLLLMQNGSRISTSAGIAGAGGNGGKITLNAPNGFLVTAPNENNDITANAFNGSGGSVTITAQGVYWFTPRSRSELAQLLGTNDPTQLNPFRLPTNDITAISQGNPTLNGVISINTPDVDPNRGLVALPVEPTTPQVAEGCQTGSRSTSRFVVTGRGGLPPNPGEALSSDAVDVGLVTLNSRAEERSSPAPSLSFTRTNPEEIVEAQGWVVDQSGDVMLIAQAPTATPHRSRQPFANCQTSRSNAGD